MVIILRKFLKFIGLLFLLIILYLCLDYLNPIERIKIKNALYEDVKPLKIDGYSFRDLNKNNILDVYEDHRLNSKIRTEDLLNKMTLEEKVAQMCQYVGLEHMKKAEKSISAEELIGNDALGFYKNLHSSQVAQMVVDGKIGSFLHVKTCRKLIQNL